MDGGVVGLLPFSRLSCDRVVPLGCSLGVTQAGNRGLANLLRPACVGAIPYHALQFGLRQRSTYPWRVGAIVSIDQTATGSIPSKLNNTYLY